MDHRSVGEGPEQRGLDRGDAPAVGKARERQANDVLRKLDEDHRLCRISRDEYRYRRRALLESLGDVVAQAGPDTVRRDVQAYDTVASGEMGRADVGKAERKLAKPVSTFGAVRLIEGVALLGAIALGVVLCYWLARM